jgi:GTP-binding protein
MNIAFVKSSNDPKQCPPAKFPEFAFIGRSNVGKSSLINLLASQKNLAKISVKPGKTQLINHFIVSPNKQEQEPSTKHNKKEKNWYLVDLPGYGYAKTSKTSRSHFDMLIKEYIVSRTTLNCLFVLIDSRLEPQKIDIEFITFLGENNIPFVLVFTKVDKISDNKVASNVAAFKKEMLTLWESLPEIFISSSTLKKGREEILKFIEKTVVKSK